jgi:hypothetical protein
MCNITDPGLEEDTGGIPTPENILKWRKLSSFAARCMGADVTGLYSTVIWALVDALEKMLDFNQENIELVDYKFQVACEWIFHAAKNLLNWAGENIKYLS